MCVYVCCKCGALGQKWDHTRPWSQLRSCRNRSGSGACHGMRWMCACACAAGRVKGRPDSAERSTSPGRALQEVKNRLSSYMSSRSSAGACAPEWGCGRGRGCVHCSHQHHVLSQRPRRTSLCVGVHAQSQHAQAPAYTPWSSAGAGAVALRLCCKCSREVVARRAAMHDGGLGASTPGSMSALLLCVTAGTAICLCSFGQDSCSGLSGLAEEDFTHT